jgi:hypothetical protein
MFFKKTFLFSYFQSIKRRAPGEHATLISNKAPQGSRILVGIISIGFRDFGWNLLDKFGAIEVVFRNLPSLVVAIGVRLVRSLYDFHEK